MLNAIIVGSLRNRFLVILATLIVAGLGLVSAWRLPLDAVPDMTNVQVQVMTEAPGLSPLEVETLLTFPVEAVLGGLPRVEEVRSVSKFGISLVTIVFRDGTDLTRARQLVGERLPLAAEGIPPGYGAPKLGPMATALGEIYQFQVAGEGYSLMELRTILDWFIAPQLRMVSGVTEINVHGGELMTYQITIDPDHLAERKLRLVDVERAIQANNANVGGGYLVRDGEARYIRGESTVRSLEELGRIVLAEREGSPITVADVAKVERAPMVRAGLVTRDGRGEVVTGMVMMRIGENAREVVARVKEELGRLRTSLPPGVTIEPLYDRTELVDHALGTVFRNLSEGGALVVLVLLILLGDLVGGLIVAAVIPLAMLFAANLMLACGVTASLMSLGAIDFGLIVDSSVIMVENCARRLGLEAGTRPRWAIVHDAALEVRKPTMYGELIIAIVFLPILTLQGTEGKLFQPMALTVIFALFGSMVLSMTLMPVLASLLLRSRRGREHHEVALIRWLKRIHAPALDWAIHSPKAVVGVALVLVALSIPPALELGGEFMPRLNEGDLLLEMVQVPSAALERAVPLSTQVETILKRFPEVRTVYCKTGRPEIANDVMGVHQTDVWTLLKPQDQWRAGMTREKLIEEIDEALGKEVVGARFGFSQPIEMRVNELVAGVKSDVAAILSGPDLDVLRGKADEIERVLAGIRGAADVKSPSEGRLPMLRLSVRREQLARYGIAAEEVLRVVEALGGSTVGMILDGQARHPIQVRFPSEWRDRVESIRVVDGQGRAVALSELVEVRREEGPSEVERERQQRRAVVGANVRGRDLSSFVEEAQREVARRVKLPPGYIVRWGGQFEHLTSATRRLMLVVPAALGLIVLLLYASTASWRMTGMIGLVLPMATVGGVVALFLRGLPFSVSAGIGFIALSGVAVLNGLVWVNAVDQLRHEGASAREAARQASLTRLRPILMTALTGSLGFLPMALATSLGAEIQRPLATVVIGGLISSTLLTTLVLPAVYPWFASKNDGEGPDLG